MQNRFLEEYYDDINEEKDPNKSELWENFVIPFHLMLVFYFVSTFFLFFAMEISCIPAIHTFEDKVHFECSHIKFKQILI